MPGESGEPEAGGDLLMTMRGVLALLAADRDDRVDDRKPKRSELVLADAGFKAREIATITGKPYEAIKSSLRRAKEKAER
jgi:hypothetical protein